MIPSKSIPKPAAQSMEGFRQYIRQRGKDKWVDSITKEDINSLPLILVGLNYRKYFPVPVPDKFFSKAFMNQHPDIVFTTSQFSNKTMAIGIKKVQSQTDLVNMLHHHEYKDDSEDFVHPPVKVDFSPLDEPEYTTNHQLQGTDLTKLDEIEQVFLQNQLDALPEVITIDDDEETSYSQATGNDSANIEQVIHKDLGDLDEASWSLINTIQTNDKTHGGKMKIPLIW